MRNWTPKRLVRRRLPPAFLLLALICAILFGRIGVAEAYIDHDLTPVDLAAIAPGDLLQGPELTDFVTNIYSPPVIGTLAVTVYQSAGLYTYTLEVTPEYGEEFNFGFPVGGYTGTGFEGGFNGVAGYRFTQAENAGSVTGAGAFRQSINADGTLDWAVRTDESGFYERDERHWTEKPVTFFFQTTAAPGMNGLYNLGPDAGETFNLAPGAGSPVPLPSAAVLLASGLLGGFGLMRRGRRA